jgi:arylsulfatase A-like enzyme
MQPFWSLSGFSENLRMPFVMPCLGAHTYLREGFRLSDANRRMLLSRYHRAIELMDRKLGDFWRSAMASGLLDDTMVILASDHGEGFGEHGLYLHDASVYDTHLHVPLWVHHPTRPPATVDDVVSTRDLFGLIRNAALDGTPSETILDSDYRERHSVALAEHFHYPHAKSMAPRYRQDLAAAVSGRKKVIVRREGVELYDLDKDPDELDPQRGSLDDFAEICRREGAERGAIESTVERLRRWAAEQSGRSGRRRRSGAIRLTPIEAVSSAEALSEPSPQSSPADGERQEAQALDAL